MSKNSEVLASWMPKLTTHQTLTLTSSKDRHKNNRIKLTREEIEQQTAEFLANGGEITKLDYGVYRHV